MLQRQPNCQHCGSAGQIYNPHNCRKILSLECPKCKQLNSHNQEIKVRWKSLAGTCPDCTGYNGYPGDGLCKPCYERRHGADNE